MVNKYKYKLLILTIELYFIFRVYGDDDWGIICQYVSYQKESFNLRIINLFVLFKSSK